MLKETNLYVRESKESGWDLIDPEEVQSELDQCIRLLSKRGKINFFDLAVLYAPTGTLQELAMANGWHKQYMKLANRFDALERKIKERHPDFYIIPHDVSQKNLEQ